MYASIPCRGVVCRAALIEGPCLSEMHPIICSRGFALALLVCQESSLVTWPLGFPCPPQLWQPAQGASHEWEGGVRAGGYGCHQHTGDRSIKVRGRRAHEVFQSHPASEGCIYLSSETVIKARFLSWFSAHTMNNLLEHHS